MTSQQFDILYRRNYPILYRLAFSMLRNEEECRDLVNESFADFWGREDKNSIENIDGYLFKVVRNKAFSSIQSLSIVERFRRLYPIELELGSGYDLDYDKKLEQVQEFLDKELSSQTREVIRLIFENGKSYKMAADLLGVSVSAINKHVVKALRLLRNEFISNI